MIARILVRVLDRLNRWLEQRVIPWAAKETARRDAACREYGHAGKGPTCTRCGTVRPDLAQP